MNAEVTAERIKALLEGTLPGVLGVEVVSIEDEEAVGRLVVQEHHLHPFGFAHGGSWVTLADSVAAWATMRHLPPGSGGFTTIELKTNVFAGAREGDELVATAKPLHTGKRTQAWEVRVHREERLMALFTCTQMVLSS